MSRCVHRALARRLLLVAAGILGCAPQVRVIPSPHAGQAHNATAADPAGDPALLPDHAPPPPIVAPQLLPAEWWTTAQGPHVCVWQRPDLGAAYVKLILGQSVDPAVRALLSGWLTEATLAVIDPSPLCAGESVWCGQPRAAGWVETLDLWAEPSPQAFYRARKRAMERFRDDLTPDERGLVRWSELAAFGSVTPGPLDTPIQRITQARVSGEWRRVRGSSIVLAQGPDPQPLVVGLSSVALAKPPPIPVAEPLTAGNRNTDPATGTPGPATVLIQADEGTSAAASIFWPRPEQLSRERFFGRLLELSSQVASPGTPELLIAADGNGGALRFEAPSTPEVLLRARELARAAFSGNPGAGPGPSGPARTADLARHAGHARARGELLRLGLNEGCLLPEPQPVGQPRWPAPGVAVLVTGADEPTDEILKLAAEVAPAEDVGTRPLFLVVGELVRSVSR